MSDDDLGGLSPGELDELTDVDDRLAARVAALEEELAAGRAEVEAKHELVLGLEGQVQELRQALTGAAQRYRELLLASNPEVPADLVQGESIEEVEASLQEARRTVLQVRRHLESEAQAGGPAPRG